MLELHYSNCGDVDENQNKVRSDFETHRHIWEMARWHSSGAERPLFYYFYSEGIQRHQVGGISGPT